MPEFQGINCELTGLQAKHTDRGTAWEIKCLIESSEHFNAIAVGSRLKKSITISLGWTAAEQAPMFDRAGNPAPLREESMMGVTCTAKQQGTCHSHKSQTGERWHCKEEPGKTFEEACAHIGTDTEPGDHAEGGEVESWLSCEACEGTGSLRTYPGPDEVVIESCPNCDGTGKRPVSTQPINPDGEESPGGPIDAAIDGMVARRTMEIVQCPDCKGSGVGAPIEGTEMSEPCRTCAGEKELLVDIGAPPAEEAYEPDPLPPVDAICGACQGSGEIGQGKKAKVCAACGGTGHVQQAQEPPAEPQGSQTFVESPEGCTYSFYAAAGHCAGHGTPFEVAEPCEHVRATMTAEEPVAVGAGAAGGPSGDDIPF